MIRTLGRPARSLVTTPKYFCEYDGTVVNVKSLMHPEATEKVPWAYPFRTPSTCLYTLLFTMKRVSLLPVPAEARVRFQTIPVGICGGQSGTRTVVSPSTSVSPVSFIVLVRHIHSFITDALFV